MTRRIKLKSKRVLRSRVVPLHVEQTLELYSNHMKEVRDRLNVIRELGSHTISTRNVQLDLELGFLQFRKALENIALASLVANKDVYAAAHRNFERHWKAVEILNAIEMLNPNFYPCPLQPPKLMPDKTKRFDRIDDGFLTKDEFATLYDVSSKALHSRNPFSTDPLVIRMPYTPKGWVDRLQKLIEWHAIELVNGDRLIATAPSTGEVKAGYGSRGLIINVAVGGTHV